MHAEFEILTLLSLLIIYTRLLKPYSAIFVDLYEHLTALSETESPRILPLAIPSLGNLPIRPYPFINRRPIVLTCLTESGTLPLIIFTDVVTNFFETTEILLGLPEEFWMKRQSRERHGLLDTPELLDVTRCILSKASNSTHDGGMGARGLRKQIVKLRKLLRDRFAP
jgi:hypothetical protein